MNKPKEKKETERERGSRKEMTGRDGEIKRVEWGQEKKG